jgi:cytoskeletal protein RodZ
LRNSQRPEEHFGILLRRGREARGLTLADLSRATKIKECMLSAIEAGALERLPPIVFVRGFVAAYAREVGVDAEEPLRRLGERLQPIVEPEPPIALDAAPPPGETGVDGRRRFGVALVVLLILVVATLTLSLLLRHGDRPGGPISWLGVEQGDVHLDRG